MVIWILTHKIPVTARTIIHVPLLHTGIVPFSFWKSSSQRLKAWIFYTPFLIHLYWTGPRRICHIMNIMQWLQQTIQSIKLWMEFLLYGFLDCHNPIFFQIKWSFGCDLDGYSMNTWTKDQAFKSLVSMIQTDEQSWRISKQWIL